MSQLNVIRFNRTSDHFGEFSNFARFPIYIKGVEWPTSEHFFQAQKFVGTTLEHTIRHAKTPAIAARIGRDRRHPLRQDWDAVKDDVMREAVLAKFAQHMDLLKLLWSTEEAQLVEHTKRDAYWGDGGNGSGRNMLGRILMETREKLRDLWVFQDPLPTTNIIKTGDSSLCNVRYVRHEFHASPEPRQASLVALMYDIPYLGACGIFPPLPLLNRILKSGGSDGGMSPGTTWRPFELSEKDYTELIGALKSTPVEVLRDAARYCFIQFKLDSSFDDLTDYSAWMKAICEKYRRR